MSGAAFRQLLEAGDVDGLRRAWRTVMPRMPQPKSFADAEIMMHMARTSSEACAFKGRAYSHRWLTERLLPSQLPDHLRAHADRMYPTVVEAVGVSVNFRSPFMQPAADEVRSAMAYAIEDAYADGRREPAFVKSRMFAAKDKVLKALFGRQVHG